MKISLLPSRRLGKSGMALVFVLGMLVLVVVLIVAFLSSVSTELKSAKSYARGQDARTLADTASNIVIAQIQDATMAPKLAWASQPGMIRTYDGTGQAVAAYKLYSSNTFRVMGPFDPIGSLSAEIPDDWASHPELFVDLNKPVSLAGANHYPILSASAVGKDVSGGGALEGSAPAIEGCYLDTENAAAATSAIQTNPVPMPVRWMYILKNGEITSTSSATGKIEGATPANPIIGRVAFWTDDETCKVNLNTAGEGTYWDRPWMSTYLGSYEDKLAKSMPAQNEFQRFPGHPAMTSLSTIFPPLPSEVDSLNEPTLPYKKRLYAILPRLVEGGSQAGTTAVNYLTAPLVPDNDRLFASVDELMFKPGNTGIRRANLKDEGNPFLDSDIARAKFFLTTTSRAPEVNMFNKPRITLWPLQANTTDVTLPTEAVDRNFKDKLIAFCSSIGGTPYYFQRYNTYLAAPNTRASGTPYNPSQSPRPSSQTPSMDWDLIPRNREIFAYLQSLTSTPIPGLGGTMAGLNFAKYNPPTRDQIVTEMLDFIRSNVNTVSNGGSPRYAYAPYIPNRWVSGEFQVVPLVINPPNSTGYKTKGFGQFPTVTQAAIVFMRSDNLVVDGVEQTVSSKTYASSNPFITFSPNSTLQAFIILQPFTPTPGPPPWSANVRYRIEGLDKFQINGNPMGFPADSTNLLTCLDGQDHATALTGLELATQYYGLKIKSLGATTVGANDEEEKYPFFSSVIPFTSTDSTFTFSGGKITIKIYPGYAKSLDDDDLVQTIHMDFPGATLPIPIHAYIKSSATIDQYNTVATRFGSLETGGGYGIQRNGKHNPLPLVRATDTVRAIEARYLGPTLGDYRLIAGRYDVPDSYFEGHGLRDAPADGRKYSDSSVASRLMHSLRVDAGSGSSPTSNNVNGFYTGSGTPHGKLLAAAAYYTGAGGKGNREPVAPRGLPEAIMSNGEKGDWDTGIGRQRDGPYVNKADLGNVGSSSATTNGYYNANGFDRSASAAVVTENGSSFSPNRQIASAVSFGSLPSGINPSNPNDVKPWQTLLFCPNPLAGATHPGFGIPAEGTKLAPPYSVPPDHALLDLFTMPIVEPYAITEPFSTAGKINMNYQIVPFTYLTRNTAIRAALRSTRIMAIPTSLAPKYKENQSTPTATSNPDCRFTLNLDDKDGTLKGFQDRFNTGDIFRSASEICDIFLVPNNNVDGSPAPDSPTYDKMPAWWSKTYQLTGENLRESPYGQIYPRLTTKSNTYTVHVQTQLLTKSPTTSADVFDESRDRITGEFRGSYVIERFLDPNSDSLIKVDGSMGSETDPDSMVGPYKFRIVSSKRFAP